MTGNVRIAWQSSGSGPALICCHAFGADHTLWDRHRACFSQHHQLVTFDQRGCGDSDHPEYRPGSEDPYTINTFAADLRAVMDHLGIERASVLGYSMGAATALRFATRWPERVERLILVSAMASRLPEEIIRRARSVEQVLAQEGLEKTYAYYFSGPLFAGIGEDAMRETAQMAKKASVQGFSGSFRVTIDRPSLANELYKISAPTLILVGEQDHHYLAEAQLMAQRIPDARSVVVKHAGHGMNVQVPAVFESAVMDFLLSPLPHPDLLSAD
jgi:pimeloyl-ACP methyl ester carboxylesterase